MLSCHILHGLFFKARRQYNTKHALRVSCMLKSWEIGKTIYQRHKATHRYTPSHRKPQPIHSLSTYNGQSAGVPLERCRQRGKDGVGISTFFTPQVERERVWSLGIWNCCTHRKRYLLLVFGVSISEQAPRLVVAGHVQNAKLPRGTTNSPYATCIAKVQSHVGSGYECRYWQVKKGKKHISEDYAPTRTEYQLVVVISI
jgi:hypothetical protein